MPLVKGLKTKPLKEYDRLAKGYSKVGLDLTRSWKNRVSRREPSLYVKITEERLAVGAAAAAVEASLLLANGLSFPSSAQMEAAPGPEAAPPAAPAAGTQVKEKIFEKKEERGKKRRG